VRATGFRYHRRTISANWIRRAFVLVSSILLLVAPLRVRADESPLLKLLREYIESLRVQAGIPGLAVTVVGPDDILWEQAFGRRDIERAFEMRTDTPVHIDGITQAFTATLLLRCIEEGRLSLDARVGQFRPDSPDPNATIRQLLTHTSTGAFEYRPDRLDPLVPVVRACAVDSYRKSLTKLFDRLAMIDSVPGPDVIHLTPPAEGIPDAATSARYARVLDRLATPYSVDSQKRATPSKYPATTLKPGSGVISTARDLVEFDLALKRGQLLLPATIADAWTPAGGGPHGLGWFAQTYNGEKFVWQFGIGDNASSALLITQPSRRITYILLANSAGLAAPLPTTASQLMASPFVRVLVGFFAGSG
jgi:CubicO group peptidase (beta-lactamase class C family)